MVQELKSGLTALNILDGGSIIDQMEKVNFIMQMVICMMVSGRTTRQTAMVCTLTSTERSMKATGKMIFRMAKELNAGQMDLSTTESTKAE